MKWDKKILQQARKKGCRFAPVYLEDRTEYRVYEPMSDTTYGFNSYEQMVEFVKEVICA